MRAGYYETQEGWDKKTISVCHEKVGFVEWKVWVSLSNGDTGEDDTLIEVKDPNRNTVSGVDTDSTGFPVMQNELRFTLYYNDTPLGPCAVGTVQERIRREPPYADPPFDSGWVGPAENFFFQSPDIVDRKITTPPAGWDFMLNETVIDEFTQEVRITIPDWCGNEWIYTDVSPRRYRRVKTSGTTIQFQLVP
jgi:hypothetical protein